MADRSQLQMLEALSDASLSRKSTDWVLMELDLLRDQDKSVYTQLKVAENELRATERLRRLAAKHEEAALTRGLAADAAHLVQAMGVYQERWARLETQWSRLWHELEARVDAAPSDAA